MRLQISKGPLNFLRILCYVQKYQIVVPNISYYATTVDTLDAFTQDLLQKHRSKLYNNNFVDVNKLNIRPFAESDAQNYNVKTMTTDELDKVIVHLHSKNKDKLIELLVIDCISIRKFIGESTIKMLFRHYSNTGRPDMILIFQKYCAEIDPNLNRRNGGFQHYLAKAQCMKGNSEKGLEILKQSYKKNEGLRSLYRIIFKELIHDSVLNRSEASLVIFKKYVLDFSKTWEDHYPLVCFWHICWSSSWFSDQMLSNDLLECSTNLQAIIKDKAIAFSINVLRGDYNEDAVIRLLQILLKYKWISEYVKVLQVLFNFKLRNRDIRGCTEIIRNCEALGVTLPTDQQGRYIRMLIDGQTPEKQATHKVPSKHFKYKF